MHVLYVFIAIVLVSCSFLEFTAQTAPFGCRILRIFNHTRQILDIKVKLQVIWISGSFITRIYFRKLKKKKNHPVYKIKIFLEIPFQRFCYCLHQVKAKIEKKKLFYNTRIFHYKNVASSS